MLLLHHHRHRLCWEHGEGSLRGASSHPRHLSSIETSSTVLPPSISITPTLLQVHEHWLALEHGHGVHHA